MISITTQQTHTTHTAVTSSSPHIKSHLKIQLFLIYNYIPSLKTQKKKETIIKMAAITSAAVTIPTSFTGLKAGLSSSKAATAVVATRAIPKFAVKASLKNFGVAVAVAVAATAASAMLASNALAVDVKLGGDDGSLSFLPGEFVVASGEKITFINNAGFPHNVVFDDDNVPAGVDVSKISMNEEALLNAKGETYTVSLTEKGTYTFYCSPHQGAGMVGKVTVK